MSIQISYMGTKRALAGEVQALSRHAKRGPFLDLFCGMCAVGSTLAVSRQVWSNDLQHFATNVASASFCSVQQPSDAVEAFDTLRPHIEANTKFLQKEFSMLMKCEETSLENEDLGSLQTLFKDRISAANLFEESSFAYDIFTMRFGATYFSLRQCIAIDSFVYAIDKAFGMNAEQHCWLKIALAVAMSRCTTSTGHFAQPLKPNLGNLKKIVSQRRRKVSHEFVSALNKLRATGSRRWRDSNRVFREEACNLLEVLHNNKGRPGLIYADPPYTKDQYSRYYHLYETVILYDHPASVGTGLYRSDRKVSNYCLATKVESSMEELIRRSRSLQCDLILSYPTNGLLEESHRKIPSLMQKHYRKKPVVLEITHQHSTMGASKGSAKHPVTEVLYMAQLS